MVVLMGKKARKPFECGVSFGLCHRLLSITQIPTLQCLRVKGNAPPANNRYRTESHLKSRCIVTDACVPNAVLVPLVVRQNPVAVVKL